MTVITPVFGGISRRGGRQAELWPDAPSSAPRSIVTFPFRCRPRRASCSRGPRSAFRAYRVRFDPELLHPRPRHQQLHPVGCRLAESCGGRNCERLQVGREPLGDGGGHVDVVIEAPDQIRGEGGLDAGSWISWVLALFHVLLSNIWRLTQVARITSRPSSEAIVSSAQTAVRLPRLNEPVGAGGVAVTWGHRIGRRLRRHRPNRTKASGRPLQRHLCQISRFPHIPCSLNLKG